MRLKAVSSDMCSTRTQYANMDGKAFLRVEARSSTSAMWASSSAVVPRSLATMAARAHSSS
jgi:hypothetical protein